MLYNTGMKTSVAYTDDQIAAMNKTARSAGCIGGRAVVPRWIAENVLTKQSLILDYGAGPAAIHTKWLREQGFSHVCAFEIGDNWNENVHVTQASLPEHGCDIVFASNVMNVQPSRPAVVDAFMNMASLVGNGIVVFNYPKSPRRSTLSDAQMVSLAEAIIGPVFRFKVGSTPVYVAVKR